MTTAIVVAGGPQPPVEIADRLPRADAVVVADSGLDNARALGLRPDLVVGDLDSISAAGLAWARQHRIPVVEHPADKDATDLDLALASAAATSDRVVVVDSGVGRLDHATANLLLLSSDRFAATEVTAHVGSATVTVVWHRRELRGRAGDAVTLLAPGGVAGGVSTEGLTWPLADEVLEPGSTLGVSNVFAGEEAAVSVRSGVLLVIQPDGAPRA